jgi:hypothetical protein
MPNEFEALPEGATVVADRDQKTVIDQINSVVGGGTDGQIAGGVCVAMCGQWVNAGVTQGNFWSGLDTEEALLEISETQHREMSFQQKQAHVVGAAVRADGTVDSRENADGYKRVLAGHDQGKKQQLLDVMEEKTTWFAKMLGEKTGLQRDDSFEQPSTEFANLVGYQVAMGKAGYFVLHANFKAGGHAMAVHVGTDQSVHFLDPNYGEVKFATRGEFGAWFTNKHIDRCQKSFGEIVHCNVDAFPAAGSMNRPDESEGERWKHISQTRRLNETAIRAEMDALFADVLEGTPESTPSTGAAAAAAAGPGPRRPRPAGALLTPDSWKAGKDG